MRKGLFGIIMMFALVTLAMPAFAATALKFASIHEPTHPSATRPNSSPAG